MTFTKAQRIKGLKKQAENLGMKLVGGDDDVDVQENTEHSRGVDHALDRWQQKEEAF